MMPVEERKQIARRFTVGHACFIDTFSGFVPARVVRISKPGYGFLCADGAILVEVTKDKGGYRAGEQVEFPAKTIIPKECVRRGTYSNRIDTNYLWE